MTSQHATAVQSLRRAEPPAGFPHLDPELKTHLRGQTESLQHSPTQTEKNHRRRAMIITYRHVSSLTGEIRSRLQRVLEAGHRPLAVSGAPCRGFVQRQVPDATDETTGARSLKVVTEQHRHMIHDASNVAFVTLSCVSEPRVCDVKSGCFTVSEGGTPPTYKGPVRRVRSPPGSLFD